MFHSHYSINFFTTYTSFTSFWRACSFNCSTFAWFFFLKTKKDPSVWVEKYSLQVNFLTYNRTSRGPITFFTFANCRASFCRPYTTESHSQLWKTHPVNFYCWFGYHLHNVFSPNINTKFWPKLKRIEKNYFCFHWNTTHHFHFRFWIVIFQCDSLRTMSSLRKAIPQKYHKERHQPRSRKKFGFLEKHKDYVLRARDYHRKQDQLRKLEEKASFRNPDEFYFKMIKTKRIVCE